MPVGEGQRAVGATEGEEAAAGPLDRHAPDGIMALVLPALADDGAADERLQCGEAQD